MLLFGPAGSGKTHIAQAVLAEIGLPVFTIRGPEVFSAYVGASEGALRDVFVRAAACAPSIVFIDEIDAMCPKRGEASEVML